MHGKDAKSSASVRILVRIRESEGAREARKIDHLRQDSSLEAGAAGCTGRMPNQALEAGFQSGGDAGGRTGGVQN